MRIGFNKGKVVICTEAPYKNCAVYGPYTRKQDGRKIVRIVQNKKITTSLYSRYLMEVHIGKELTYNEVVDHIDRDDTNDVLSNFRIVTRRKNSQDDIPRAKKIKLECTECKKQVIRTQSDLRNNYKSNSYGIFCTRRCRSKYSRKMQLGKAQKPERMFTDEELQSEYYLVDKVIDSNNNS